MEEIVEQKKNDVYILGSSLNNLQGASKLPSRITVRCNTGKEHRKYGL